MAYFFAPLATDLSKQWIPRSHQETGGSLFIPTSVKHLFVTSLLWLLLISACALSMIGAWTLGVKIAHFLAVSL